MMTIKRDHDLYQFSKISACLPCTRIQILMNSYKIKFNMNIIIFLIIISILVAGAFLGAFFWAVRSGQYDDDYTPSVRILLDDDMIKNKEQNNS
jgi:cbb3-type cytochrome oxidase maturation protein